MRLGGKKGQAAIEYLLIIGAIVVLVVPIVSVFVRDYVVNQYGEDLKANFQAQVRYALPAKDEYGIDTSSLGKKDGYALRYQFGGGVTNWHPYAYVTPVW